MSQREYDLIFNVTLLGESGVGKTSIMNGYARPRIDFYCHNTTTHVKGITVKLDIRKSSSHDIFLVE